MAVTVHYDSAFDAPFYSGSALADATLVPGLFQVAINGHPYMLNTEPNEIDSYRSFFKEESLPLLRAQSDDGNRPGEQSVSPAQFWRRSQDSWHTGAGQSMLDRDISVATRFSASKGINPWTKYQLTLLADTTRILTSSNTAMVCATTNSAFYVADGTVLRGTANLSGFTTVTGLPALQALDLATDGALVYGAYGASGIYSVNGSVATSFVTGTVSHVGFAKGHLLAAHNNLLYNIVASGALPGVPLMTHPTTGWTWSAFCEGDTQIYMSGSAGDTSRIYRTATTTDATALAAPIVAASLPKGEIVRSMLGYLGFIVIGTDKGVRFATSSATGDLTLGALIPTPGPVFCLDSLDRFVWFAWSNYDGVSTGLGRFDLTTISDGQAPAYASDLMATGQGTVRGLGQILGRHVFAVDGLGVYAEATTAVASGAFTTGQINYGLSDPKVPVYIDLKHQPLASGQSVAVAMSLDRAAANPMGTSNAPGSVSPGGPISTGARSAEEIELSFTLAAAAGVGPTLTRWTLLSYPAPQGASTYTLPLLLVNRGTTDLDTEYTMDPYVEYLFLRDLHDTRELVTVQVGSITFEGTLEEFVWEPHDLKADQGWWTGNFICNIRRIKG